MVTCQVSMAHRCCSGRRHYDSNSSDTELSEAEESRKSCIKRSKLVCFPSDVAVRYATVSCNQPVDVWCFLCYTALPHLVALGNLTHRSARAL